MTLTIRTVDGNDYTFTNAAGHAWNLDDDGISVKVYLGTRVFLWTGIIHFYTGD